MTQQTDDKAPDLQAEETQPIKTTCRGCNLWDTVKERVRINELIESAITKLEDKLKGADFKPTLADYLKLMQLEKEFQQEQVKEIKVSWVTPAPSSETEK